MGFEAMAAANAPEAVLKKAMFLSDDLTACAFISQVVKAMIPFWGIRKVRGCWDLVWCLGMCGHLWEFLKTHSSPEEACHVFPMAML